MILRRFTQHLDDQNWFAVSLDLIVVVLGIFIGLQVTDWNQSRRDYDNGLYYLSALNSQILDEIEKETIEISSSEKHMESTFQAVSILWSERIRENDLEDFQKRHFSAFFFWGPRTRPAALRQLIDGGKIDLIQSKEMQKYVLNFESSYVEAIQQTQTSYAYSKDFTSVIMNELEYRGPRVISTLEEMKSNKELISALRGKAIFQRIQLDVLKEITEVNQNMQEQLASYLGEAR